MKVVKIMGKTNFEGISTKALEVLFEIKMHDSREYFAERRNDYKMYAVEPFKCLVAQLAPTMLEIDPSMQVTPAIGKTISRINRDIRFSKDKSLYRDSMWFFIRKQGNSWLDAPGFWFEIKQNGFGYGVGMFCAVPKMMEIYREFILNDPSRFEKLTEIISELDGFAVEGEIYKKDKGSQGLPENLKSWFNRKEVFISFRSTDYDKMNSPELAQDIADSFKKLAPFYYFAMDVFNEYNLRYGGVL